MGFKDWFKKDKPPKEDIPAPDLPEEPSEYKVGDTLKPEPVLSKLVDLLLTLKVKGSSEEINEQMAAITQLLINLLPKLNKDHADSDLTWAVNQMSTGFLTDTVIGYIKLSADSREAQSQEFLGQLDGLHSELKDIGEAIEQERVDQFQAKADILSSYCEMDR